MTELTPELREYYAKAAAEMKKRGRVKFKLAEISVAKATARGGYDIKPVSPKKCRVCLIGAVAAAYYDDPRRGYDRDHNGYDTLILHLADIIKPEWRADWAIASEDRHTPEVVLAGIASDVVIHFHDSVAKDDDEVYAVLEKAFNE